MVLTLRYHVPPTIYQYQKPSIRHSKVYTDFDTSEIVSSACQGFHLSWEAEFFWLRALGPKLNPKSCLLTVTGQ